MRSNLAYKIAPDVFAQAKDRNASLWRMFLGLAIKDYHLDISSLIDAIAPVVIQADSEIKSKDRVSLPGWEAIESGTKRSYRKKLTPEMIGIVDSIELWWTPIKKVRDLLTHRKHDRIVFGNSEDGLLFQIYDQVRTPRVILPEVLYQKGYNVVDFDLYSAFIISEIITLFDELGVVIAHKINIQPTRASQMMIRMVDRSIAQSIKRLIKAAGQYNS